MLFKGGFNVLLDENGKVFVDEHSVSSISHV